METGWLSSPLLVLSDFNLFRYLKQFLCGNHIVIDDEMNKQLKA